MVQMIAAWLSQDVSLGGDLSSPLLSCLGAVGLIAPWNFPWAIPVWKSAPALVAGNTVVFKPAELTPATSALLAEIYEAAGLPGIFGPILQIDPGLPEGRDILLQRLGDSPQGALRTVTYGPKVAVRV